MSLSKQVSLLNLITFQYWNILIKLRGKDLGQFVPPLTVWFGMPTNDNSKQSWEKMLKKQYFS